ncbi:hypothetical protein M2271_001727 [Streptomyces sp. LBL]|nr:hypothetical protein [Streptomyces sp. LBL]
MWPPTDVVGGHNALCVRGAAYFCCDYFLLRR